MKGLISVLLILGMLSSPVAADAKSRPKEVVVELSAAPGDVFVGDTVLMTAVTSKHGTVMNDSWENALKVKTVIEPESEHYAATAEFVPTEPGDYVINYTIQMKAGKNGPQFTGRSTITISVKDKPEEAVLEKTVTGAQLHDVTATAARNSLGAITGYSVMGNLYALMSDGSEVDLQQAVFLFFKPEETQKTMDASFFLEDKEYRLPVVVTRPNP